MAGKRYTPTGNEETLSAPPRAARQLMGSGRLPEVQNLIRKTPEELIYTLNRFGIQPDIKAIDRRARKAFHRLENIIDEGVEPDEATWKSIETMHEREMEGTLRQMAKNSIRLYQQNKIAGEADKFMWVTRGDEAVCPSCEPRHGEIKTMAQWRVLGLPGSGALICSAECRCQLVPAD